MSAEDLVPDEDFAAVNKDAADDDFDDGVDSPGASYDTDDEDLDADVSSATVSFCALSPPVCAVCKIEKLVILASNFCRRHAYRSSDRIFWRGLQERLADKEARALARSERNRLKAQDAAKKRQLDKLRLEQNSSVDDGEVRRAPLEIFACLLACWCLRLTAIHRLFIANDAGFNDASRMLEVALVDDLRALLTRVTLRPLQKLRGERRLQFMLKQAEVFQHFAPETAENTKRFLAPCLAPVSAPAAVTWHT